jgi:hypothetical protein
MIKKIFQNSSPYNCWTRESAFCSCTSVQTAIKHLLYLWNAWNKYMCCASFSPTVYKLFFLVIYVIILKWTFINERKQGECWVIIDDIHMRISRNNSSPGVLDKKWCTCYTDTGKRTLWQNLKTRINWCAFTKIIFRRENESMELNILDKYYLYTKITVI